MAKTIDIKQASRSNWVAEPRNEFDYPGDENIKIGCLQRIADATELMAKDRQKLIDDYEWMKKSRANYIDMYHTEQRRTAALKGVVRKLKKQLAEITPTHLK